jgi:hypothetical protein
MRRGTLGVLFLALLACGERAPPDGLRYFPLHAGVAWQYRVLRTTMDGAHEMRHIVSAVAPGDALPASVGRRITLGGQRYDYQIGESGIHRLTANGNELVLPRLLAAGSTWQAAGQTVVLESSAAPWESLFRVRVALAMNYRIQALDARVDTPAGRFENCVLVSGRGTADTDIGGYIGQTRIEIESREWYAPDVGLVRMEREERSDAAALRRGALVVELDRWTSR